MINRENINEAISIVRKIDQIDELDELLEGHSRFVIQPEGMIDMEVEDRNVVLAFRKSLAELKESYLNKLITL